MNEMHVVHTPTIAIDLDGVLAEWHGWKGTDVIGPPIYGAKQMCDTLIANCHITIHTCRSGTFDKPVGSLLTDQEWVNDRVKVIEGWLRLHNIPFTSVWCGLGKPVADVYLDDRAITATPMYYAEPQERFIHMAECFRAIRNFLSSNKVPILVGENYAGFQDQASRHCQPCSQDEKLPDRSGLHEGRDHHAQGQQADTH